MRLLAVPAVAAGVAGPQSSVRTAASPPLNAPVGAISCFW